MPTYEYRCSKGHEFEQLQRMSEDPLSVCTVCGAPAERMMSAGAGLLFKGSGFYITDYRSDSYKKAADADSGGSSKKDAAPSKDATPAKDAAKSSGSSGSASSKGE
ncbi:MAG TPA: FmdB family zinc ribbon protein [Longimicrobiales bacterium]|nr:FmdB family zinc ribbon protein [Longimicrobiales bacterium]